MAKTKKHQLCMIQIQNRLALTVDNNSSWCQKKGVCLISRPNYLMS